MELESVAQGIAQTQHERESDAGEQVQRRQEGAVARKTREAPGEDHQVEAREIESGPAEKLPLELPRRANDEEGLQFGERHHAGEYACVAQGAIAGNHVEDGRRGIFARFQNGREVGWAFNCV
ncbi:MAG: hypothetical protein WDO73_20110 [Ignavibacteriota bacterium]